jgi:hypothetical protein
MTLERSEMLNPDWYYDPVHRLFVAFADGEAGCSRFEFNGTGEAIRRSPVRRPGGFAAVYRADLKSMTRIGTLENHLNIHDALKRGRLSDVVIAELQRKAGLR